jgi:methionyl aminopeptidase
MIKIKNKYELSLMRKSGQIASSALRKALKGIQIGVTEIDIDKIAEEEIYKLGGDLSYKSVPGYKFATCITVNEEVVHGIPTKRKIASGDLVSIDLATVYKGWHTDCAWTVLVNMSKDGIQSEKLRFLSVGEEALNAGLTEAVEGNKVGDISHAIQTMVEGAGYKIVKSLVGHGIGKNLHEDPEVPGYGDPHSGSLLKSGMTLAIEVIYAQKQAEVKLGSDGWTYSTIDGSLGGLFETSIIVGKEKAEILTDWR